MSRVVDLWHTKEPDTGKKVKTARHGKGKRWQSIWTNGRGGEQKKSFDYKDAAQTWIKDQDRLQFTGRRRGTSNLTVKEAVELYLKAQTHWAPRTRFTAETTLRGQVVKDFENALLQDVTVDDVRAWVEDRTARLQSSTLTTYYGVFRAFLNWCADEEHLPISPAQRVRLPRAQERKQHFLTPPQFWDFQAAFDPHFHDALETAVTTGVRPGELWELRGGDVGQKPGRIRVERSVTEVKSTQTIGPTKTGQARDAPVLENIEKMLIERAEKVGPDGLLFTNLDGSQMRQPRFRENHVDRAVKQVGLPRGFRLYDLRHTAASWAIREGASVLAVQRMLGHSTPTETLNTYAHLFDDELDQVTASISKMLDRHRTATGGRKAA